MAEEEGNGGDAGRWRTAGYTVSDGIITYKKRKRGLGDSWSDLLGDVSVSSGGQKAMEVQHGTLTCNGVDEVGEPARIQRHWKTVLEQLLPSQDVGADGIWSCIQKALMSGQFAFTNKYSTLATQAKYTCEGIRNFCGETKRVNNFLKAAEKHEDSTSSELRRDTNGQADVCVISRKCQNVLIEVLVSDKFALLCDLLLENFPGIKADSIIDLCIINSKMKSGAYGPSARLHHDLQQVWERIRKIGQEMSLLATSLSNISQTSCQSQREDELGVGICGQEYQKPSGVGTEEKNSMDSHTVMQFPCESDRSTKPEQTEASCLYKVSTCKECGDELDARCNIICNGCEAIYHLTCMLEVQGTPPQNWYCPFCMTDKRESVEHNIVSTHLDRPHQNCVICERLKTSDKRESVEQNIVSTHPDRPHQNCVICERLKTSDKRESVEHNIVSTHLDRPHQNCVVYERLKTSDKRKSVEHNIVSAIPHQNCVICERLKTSDKRKSVEHNIVSTIPHQNCVICERLKTSDKRESVEHNMVSTLLDRPHQNCVICERLKTSDKRKSVEHNIASAIPHQNCVICERLKTSDKRKSVEHNIVSTIPHQNCVICERMKTSDKRESVEHNMVSTLLDRPHQNCVICERLKTSDKKRESVEHNMASTLLDRPHQNCVICERLKTSDKKRESVEHNMASTHLDRPHQNCVICERLKTSDKRESVEHNIVSTHLDRPHQNCVVCERLKTSGMIEQATNDDLEIVTTDESRESSVSSMDSKGPPQPSRTAMANLCKICGTCEDDDKRFVTCGHSLCLYKYYHIRCLKTSQVAIQPQARCWYCPSCLCRACLKDEDDDLIVMCDGCDEAYHAYCMKPPRTSVPRGKWYCVACNILRAKQGMKNYEQWVKQQHKKSDENLCNGSNGSMDLLVSAVEKVERLEAVRKNR